MWFGLNMSLKGSTAPVHLGGKYRVERKHDFGGFDLEFSLRGEILFGWEILVDGMYGMHLF